MLTPGKKLQLTAALAGPLAAGTARVVVALRGATDAGGGRVNHSTAVNFNGVKVGEVVWAGLARREVGFDLPAGLAVEGANTVELVRQALPGITTDTVAVDWVEVHYPRALKAVSDRLSLNVPAVSTPGVDSKRVVVDGFSGPGIVGLDVTAPSAPQLLTLTVRETAAGWSAEWASPAGAAQRVVLAGPAGLLAPASSRSADPWTCRDAGRVTYLVVTHENYQTQADALAAIHAGHGMSTRVFPATAVYDAFGCGQPVPEAIRALAAQVRPVYLCLVGDATADPKGNLGAVTAGMIPCFFAQGAFFEEPSDNPFGCMDTFDDYPEIAVGRLPVRSAAEAQAIVDKTTLRQASVSTGQSDIKAALMVTDNAMALFASTSSDMEAQFTRWGTVDKVPFANYATTAAIRAAIVAGWTAKPRYFTYSGHASATALGNNSALRTTDVATLNSGGELPAGVILACLAGYFNFTTGSDSLAEKLLKEPARGVCTLVAPAGMSAPEGQRILGREIAAAIADGRATSLGRALLLAKRRLPLGHSDVLRSFNLLGDPALDEPGAGGDDINCIAPYITAQPTPQTAVAGQSATFAVVSGGTVPLAYQWRRNGVNIVGANAATYTTPVTAAADNGAVFSVVVANAAGSATSSGAALTVRIPPSIAADPLPRTVDIGQTATFTVSAGGDAPLTYQWRRNGEDIPGATAASYTTPPAAAADDGAIFSVAVSNEFGNAVSAGAVLTVRIPAYIATQPESLAVNVGQTATFTVVAGGLAPLTYQWRRNGEDIPGAAAASYTTPATSAGDDGAVFSVRVANSAGNAVSSGAVLTVRVPPSIVSAPASRVVNVGQCASFAVSAAGTAPLAYQWRKNGTDIPGATAGTYVTPPAAEADNGALFTAVVTNAAGSVESAAAVLGVISVPPTISAIAAQRTEEDTPAGPVAFAVDHPAGADGLVLTASSSNPRVVPAGNVVFGGSGSSRTVTVTPAPNVHGRSKITITVRAGSLSARTSFEVRVRAVNDAPVINEGDSVAVSMDERGGPTAFSLRLHATDVDGDGLRWTVVSGPAHGHASTGGPGLSAAVNYRPEAGFTGTDAFTVRVSDGDLADTITVQVTVNPFNEAPGSAPGSSSGRRPAGGPSVGRLPAR